MITLVLMAQVTFGAVVMDGVHGFQRMEGNSWQNHVINMFEELNKIPAASDYFKDKVIFNPDTEIAPVPRTGAHVMFIYTVTDRVITEPNNAINKPMIDLVKLNDAAIDAVFVKFGVVTVRDTDGTTMIWPRTPPGGQSTPTGQDLQHVLETDQEREQKREQKEAK